jgi:hypothetical protein
VNETVDRASNQLGWPIVVTKEFGQWRTKGELNDTTKAPNCIAKSMISLKPSDAEFQFGLDNATG